MIDETVPVLAGRRRQPNLIIIRLLLCDAPQSYLQHQSVKSIIRDQNVAAAAEHEKRQALLAGISDRSCHIDLGSGT
jgi:hypothetical protein